MERETELLELQSAMKKAKNRRDYERFQAIFLSIKGYKQAQIAEIIGRCIKTVSQYQKAYRNNGLSGLRMGHSTGKPPKLTAAQRHHLREIIAYRQPADVGFPAKHNWTLSLVCQYIQREWKETYTLRGASKLLHSLGLSYTRPTYTLQKAAPKKQDTFVQETFPALKKAD